MLGQVQCLRGFLASETTVHCGHVPGFSISCVQDLMLDPHWEEAQESPIPSGKGSHMGWKDVLWYVLSEPGWALLCKEEAPASTALLAAPVPGSGSSMEEILTRVSFTRNVEACVVLVIPLCVISFQHTPSWQVMIFVVIKSMVPSFPKWP